MAPNGRSSGVVQTVHIAHGLGTWETSFFAACALCAPPGSLFIVE